MELSNKQERYREFFFDLMAEYEVTSPSQLDYEKRIEFFKAVKSGWKKVKKQEFTEAAIPVITSLIKEYKQLSHSNRSFDLLLNSIKTNIIVEATEKYDVFFKRKLKQYNVSSPDELSEEQIKKFFNEIQKEWK